MYHDRIAEKNDQIDGTVDLSKNTHQSYLRAVVHTFC